MDLNTIQKTANGLIAISEEQQQMASFLFSIYTSVAMPKQNMIMISLVMYSANSSMPINVVS